jgi:hypothetical protein
VVAQMEIELDRQDELHEVEEKVDQVEQQQPEEVQEEVQERISELQLEEVVVQGHQEEQMEMELERQDELHEREEKVDQVEQQQLEEVQEQISELQLEQVHVSSESENDSTVRNIPEKRVAASSRYPKRSSLSAARKKIIASSGTGTHTDDSDTHPKIEHPPAETAVGISSSNEKKMGHCVNDDTSSEKSNDDATSDRNNHDTKQTKPIDVLVQEQLLATTATSTTTESRKSSAGPFADVSTAVLLEQLDGLRFEDFILKNFNLNRKGVGKTQTTIEKVSNWKKDLIKLSLLSHPETDVEKAAVQVFRNITGYMGDRSSKKSKLQHIKKIYDMVQKHSNSKFQDEIFCQVCKQTNKNPSLASTINGWEIMMLCLAVFPPSANLMMYLMAYCASVVESVRSNDPKVLKFAEVCLHNVQKITTLGRQMETPSDEDIEKIQSGIIVYNLKSYQI